MKRYKNLINNFLAILFFTGSLFASILLIHSSYSQTSQPEAAQSNIFQEGEEGTDATNDYFSVTSEDVETDGFEVTVPEVLGYSSDSSVNVEYTSIELPLYKKDYYGGKYTNAKAGANELNQIPTLSPGSKIRILRDGYVTINWKKGYVKASTGVFGSGICWTVSAFGASMDKANSLFQNKYGVPLFVFSSRDRAPHGHFYSTYASSNRGYGYTIFKGKNGQDYTFQVNPEIKKIPNLSDLKVKIVLSARSDHPSAYKGQAIGAKIYTNKDFIKFTYSSEELGPYWDDIKQSIKSVINKGASSKSD